MKEERERKRCYMAQNKHNRLTMFNSHEEIFLFTKQRTLKKKKKNFFKEVALCSSCKKKLCFF